MADWTPPEAMVEHMETLIEAEVDRLGSALGLTPGETARLVLAASPIGELVEALDDLIPRFERCARHAGSDDEFIAETTAKHRAALARARGETK